MEKKTIVARAEIMPGKEQEFVELANTLIEATRKEEGNLSYNLYQNSQLQSSFLFYEEYKDQRAIDAHASSKHFKTFAASIQSLLASELIIETF